MRFKSFSSVCRVRTAAHDACGSFDPPDNKWEGGGGALRAAGGADLILGVVRLDDENVLVDFAGRVWPS